MKKRSVLYQVFVMMVFCVILAAVIPSPALAQDNPSPEPTTVVALDFDRALILISGTVNIVLVVVVGLLVFKMSPAQVDNKLAETLQARRQDAQYMDTLATVFNGLNGTLQTVLRVAVSAGEPLTKLTPGIESDDELIGTLKDAINRADNPPENTGIISAEVRDVNR